MLQALGADALGTSSAAHAFTLGRTDGGTITLDEALAHAQDLLGAVNIPVSGDFENGFSNDPDKIAQAVKLAHEVGLSGISLEDTLLPDGGARSFELSVECIKAAASMARSLPNDFILVARADGVMNGHYQLAQAIRRLKAFDEAGADCLYVPVPGSFEDLKTVIKATSKPVNILPVGELQKYKREDFAKIGVARISLGSLLARSYHNLLLNEGMAILSEGVFSKSTPADGTEIDKLLI